MTFYCFSVSPKTSPQLVKNGLLKIPGGGVLLYMGYIGMCGPKGYGFSAVLVINRVRVLGSGPHTPTQFFWEYPPPPGENLSLSLGSLSKILSAVAYRK